MPFSELQKAMTWIQEHGITLLLEKEGEKEILCNCKWIALWSETMFWTDIIMKYVDTIDIYDHQDIIREVGLTETIQYMIKEMDGASFFYPKSQIVDYEGLLCQYALQMELREQLDDIHIHYVEKSEGEHEDRFCGEDDCTCCCCGCPNNETDED